MQYVSLGRKCTIFLHDNFRKISLYSRIEGGSKSSFVQMFLFDVLRQGDVNLKDDCGSKCLPFQLVLRNINIPFQDRRKQPLRRLMGNEQKKPYPRAI